MAQGLVQGLMWGLALVAAVAVYEVLRFSVLRRVRVRLERSVSRYLARHDVRLDRFKFTQKAYLREALLADPELNEFLATCCRERGEPLLEGVARVEEYIDEIVPAFNLVSYYKLGYGIARPLMKALYAVEFRPANLAASDAALKDGVATVYVMNHRSNADYVLFAVCMSRRIALSYAVGEWARVWPLDALFRSFGSYFVRRGEKDPLYHKTLQRYIQVVSRGGLTQGIFLEGGLSRDGRFRSPKVGLLDSLLGVTDDGGDVQFVPVGLNFDRVLEDTRLLAEAGGELSAPDAASKARSLFWVVATLPLAVLSRLSAMVVGAWQVARGTNPGFGVAAVHAGAPVSLRAWLGEERLATLRELPREERRPVLQELAEELMVRIGAQVPVTAVPLACRAMQWALAEGEGAEAAVVQHATRLLDGLRSGGAPVLLGPAFAELRGERAALDDEASAAGRPLLELTADLVTGDEARRAWEVTRAMLEEREALRVDAGRFELLGPGAALVGYYAASLDGHPAARGPGDPVAC